MRRLVCCLFAASILLLGFPGEGDAGKTRVFVGVNLGVGHPGWWGPSHVWRHRHWWGPRYYWHPAVVWPGWYPAYYYPAPRVIIEQPPVLVTPPPTQYWYYCQDPPGYYPYVSQCPRGWQQVLPQPSPPGR